MNIYVNTCWYDKAEVDEFVKHVKDKYDIKATFNDGGDWYSTWKLEGTKLNLLKLLENEYDVKSRADVEDAIEDEDDLDKLFDR